jgi:coenzyme F420-0:L-glutamate ligase/coenzyme F420-1:gamma-L-glutamate ligase
MIKQAKTIEFISIEDLPLICEGDDVAKLVIEGLKKQGTNPENNDIFVFAQKIISKAEGRMVNLNDILPSSEAIRLAKITNKDPRFVQVVLNESKKVIRAEENVLIVEHVNGFICANAGIDHSNVIEVSEESENWVLLLPKNPDESALALRKKLQDFYSLHFACLIIDSHGRAWRNGTVGISIGVSGVPGLVDLRGREDLFGFKLKVTTVGAADELAAAASLLMGQAAEGSPCILVRGFPYELRESSLSELLRDEKNDLFR